jgi:hypothetical protein
MEVVMDRSYWLKFINEAMSAHALRQIFDKTFGLIHEADVQNQFLERIEFLRLRAIDGQTVRDLDDLKDDIEIEIQHSTKLRAMQKEAKASQQEPELDTSEYISRIEFVHKWLSTESFSGSKGVLFQIEREAILKALHEASQNKSKASRILGVSVRTLRNKLNFYFGRGTEHEYSSRRIAMECLDTDKVIH